MTDTPIISYHARLRCEEMGISTKVAKGIVRYCSATWPANDGLSFVRSSRYPDYLVLASLAEVPSVVVTVLRWSPLYVIDRSSIPLAEDAS